MSAGMVVRRPDSGSLPARLTKGGAAAAVVAGGFRVASDVVDLVAVPPGGGARALLADAYMVYSGLELVFSVLLVWALVALFEHVDQAGDEPKSGRLLLFGLGLAFFGAVMAAGNSWAGTFVAPIAASEAPNVTFVATTGRAPGLMQLGVMLTYVPFTLGLLVFAGAAIRRRAYPWWQPALLVTALVSNLFLSPVSGSLSEVLPRLLLGVAFTALGWHVLSSQVPAAGISNPTRT